MKSIELSQTVDLAALAEEVRATNEPCVLRRNGEDIAVLQPVKRAGRRRARREPTAEDDAAFLAAAGSWSEVDTDRVIAANEESRKLPPRPRIDL